MPEREQQQGLDGLIDSLLSEYSDVTPRPGMETRLLASLRSEATAPAGRYGFSRWMLAGVAALVVTAAVFGVYVSIPPLPPLPNIGAAGPPLLPTPTSRADVASNGMPPSSRQNGSGRTVQMTRREELVAATTEHVRQDIFPTPTPLSDQERLLFRYQVEFPKEKLAALSKPDEPEEGTGPFEPEPQQFIAPEGQSIR